MKGDLPENCATIAAEVQAAKRQAVTVCREALGRAHALQKEYSAFILITDQLAEKQAERVDARIAKGEKLPLAGVPFAVKDLFDVEGLPTTCGSKIFARDKATADAIVVRRLVDAGAVLIGKLNMHECAFGFTGENPHYGDCKNPWNTACIPGGSSSGSAVAVALGICPFTLGSDTGGSIRHPAALSGVFGLKPTYGRVPRTGVVPLSWTMDHVGPLTRTAADAALVLKVMAGVAVADESSSRRPVPDYSAELKESVKGLRMGVPKNWFYDDLDPSVAESVQAALEKLTGLGCKRVEVKLPYLSEVVGAHRAILFPEASSYNQPYLQNRAEEYGDNIRPLLQGGLFLPAVDYLKGQRVRRVVRREWARVFESVDFLATPASPITASKFGDTTADLPGGQKPLVRAYLDMTCPFNLSGHPALSVPCGFSKKTMPIGLQLVGKPFGEATILRAAHQYQEATEWHSRMARPG